MNSEKYLTKYAEFVESSDFFNQMTIFNKRVAQICDEAVNDNSGKWVLIKPNTIIPDGIFIVLRIITGGKLACRTDISKDGVWKTTQFNDGMDIAFRDFSEDELNYLFE